MIKRIVILSIIYILLMTTVTLTMSKKGDTYLITIVVLSFIFTFMIILEIYKKYFAGFKPQNNTFNYTRIDSKDLLKISKKPFLFGLEKKIVSDHDLYFDDENFYAINRNHQAAIFKLKDITEISKTSFQINNSKIWQVKINHNNEEIVFKFAHNYTLWNKNFHTFYEKIKTMNPSAIQSKWNLWSI